MKVVQLYTDGCALGNPGDGGAGAILVCEGHQRELMEYMPQTTNNRAELRAIIMGLEALKYSCEVHVFSDSQITVKCATGEYKRQSNLDLWADYDAAQVGHVVQLRGFARTHTT